MRQSSLSFVDTSKQLVVAQDNKLPADFIAMTTQLGITDEMLDDLFKLIAVDKADAAIP